jgi:hypothetical protein
MTTILHRPEALLAWHCSRYHGNRLSFCPPEAIEAASPLGFPCLEDVPAKNRYLHPISLYSLLGESGGRNKSSRRLRSQIPQ